MDSPLLSRSIHISIWRSLSNCPPSDPHTPGRARGGGGELDGLGCIEFMVGRIHGDIAPIHWLLHAWARLPWSHHHMEGFQERRTLGLVFVVVLSALVLVSYRPRLREFKRNRSKCFIARHFFARSFNPLQNILSQVAVWLSWNLIKEFPTYM